MHETSCRQTTMAACSNDGIGFQSGVAGISSDLTAAEQVCNLFTVCTSDVTLVFAAWLPA